MMMTMSGHDSFAAVILIGHGPLEIANGLHASVDCVIAVSLGTFYAGSHPSEAMPFEDYDCPYVEGCGFPCVGDCPFEVDHVVGCVWEGFCLGGIYLGLLGDSCASEGYDHVVVSGPWVECRVLLVETGAARGGPRIELQACFRLFPRCAWHQAPFEPPLESRSRHTRTHEGGSICGPSLNPRA